MSQDAGAESARTMRIVAYSDYVCPWCYIGVARIEQLQGEFDVRVEWRPFELHPETPRSGARLAGRLGGAARARAYRDNIIALAEESELRMRMPEVIANSHLALEAAESARDSGSYGAFHRALFEAYFERGRDIGDADVLCDVARECCVDDQALRQALADESYAHIVDRSTEEARAEGILSTPTFIFDGGFRLVGAQEYAVFASVTQRLLARRAASAQE